MDTEGRASPLCYCDHRSSSLPPQLPTLCPSVCCWDHQQEHVWKSRAAGPAMLSPTCACCSCMMGECCQAVNAAPRKTLSRMALFFCCSSLVYCRSCICTVEARPATELILAHLGLCACRNTAACQLYSALMSQLSGGSSPQGPRPDTGPLPWLFYTGNDYTQAEVDLK